MGRWPCDRAHKSATIYHEIVYHEDVSDVDSEKVQENEDGYVSWWYWSSGDDTDSDPDPTPLYHTSASSDHTLYTVGSKV